MSRQGESRWPRLLTLPLLLLIGWALYELTAQPALGVAAVCVKFGWEDWRTALWLRRTDPDRRRGRACFWLYVASGLWKTTIAASLIIFAYGFLIVTGALGARGNRHLAGAFLTAFVGIVLATVTVWIAVSLAVCGGFKLWLNSAVHASRRWDVWPPAVHGGANEAGLLIGTSSFATALPILVGLVVFYVALRFADNNAGPRLARWEVVCIFALTAAFVLVPWLLHKLVRSVLAPRIFAASVAECWGTAPAPAPEAPAPLFVGDEVAASRTAASWGQPEAPDRL